MNNNTQNTLKKQGQTAAGGAPRSLQGSGGAPLPFVGLSNINKVYRWEWQGVKHEVDTREFHVRVRNRVTGEFLDIDPVQARIRRMQHRVITWAEQIEHELVDMATYMVTLTYKDVNGWRKNDIRTFMLRMKKELGDDLVAYSWVSELQKRGAVHYHVLLVTKGKSPKHPDKSKTWRHGWSRVEKARTKFYIARYVGKEYQKSGKFPYGCRMFAVYANIHSISEKAYYYIRRSALPGWLREVTDKGLYAGWGDSGEGSYTVMWERSKGKGGGWWVSGELVSSPWEYVGMVREGEPFEVPKEGA